MGRRGAGVLRAIEDSSCSYSDRSLFDIGLSLILVYVLDMQM